MGGPGEEGLTYPFPFISVILVPFLMIIIGWFNITTYLNYKEKGKKVYYIFLIFLPLAPILGIVGISLHQVAASVNYIVSMSIFAFFLGLYIVAFAIIIRGFFVNPKEKEPAVQPKE